MQSIRPFQDFAKDCAPSRWSRAASAALSIPARANSASSASASPPSGGKTLFTLPWSTKAISVFSGMVLMVSGAASAST